MLYSGQVKYYTLFFTLQFLFISSDGVRVGCRFCCDACHHGIGTCFVFQLAHVVEHTEFEMVGAMDTKQIENEWAVHQVKTTANFAPRDKVISWFVGGLNYQVEHHLFPRVSHIHYPAISKIVHDTCVRHNLPYNQYSTMTAAVASHFRMMKQLGKKPDAANPNLNWRELIKR